MSGTRLLSRKAPATERRVKPALLIVAHGERGGAGDDRLVHAVRDRLKRCGRYRTVRCCFLSKAPLLETVLQDLPAGPVIICPLFMSDGYFVRQAIPRSIRLSGALERAEPAEVRVLAPVGLNPRLPQLVAEMATHTARASGRNAEGCQLLLVAHGSKHDQASHDAACRLAETLDAAGGFAGVGASFLEESPFLDEQLRRIGGPAVAVGLFIGQGMHGAEDLPGAIETSGRDDILLSPPLARWPGLLDVICGDLSPVTAGSP